MLNKGKEYAIALAMLGAGLFIFSRIVPWAGVRIGVATNPLFPNAPQPFGYGSLMQSSASGGGGQTFDSATNF